LQDHQEWDDDPVDLPSTTQPPASPPNPPVSKQPTPPVETGPRRSSRVPKLSSAGAAMRGLTYESVLDKVLKDLRTDSHSRGGVPDSDDTVGVLVAQSEEEWCRGGF
jgi:hypothetical protein